MKVLGLKTFLVFGAWVVLCAPSVAVAQAEKKARAVQIEPVDVIGRPGPELDQAIKAEAIDERQGLRRRMRRRWRDAEPKEREQMREQREQWQSELREGLSDDERQELRRRMRTREQRRDTIRGLPEADRQALRERMELDVGEERGALRQRLRNVDPALNRVTL